MWTSLRPDATAILKDRRVRTSLARYFDVMEDNKPAKFLIAQHLSADYSHEDSLPQLWQLHDRLTRRFYQLQEKIDTHQRSFQKPETAKRSYLDLKIEIARRMLKNCSFCTRSCRANRLQGEKGFCGCGAKIQVSTIFQHWGEEPELVPSGTIFTMGCSLRCLHCQNWSISQWYEEGEICSPDRLARSIENLRKRGCRNANLVGGDPTPWLQQWLEAFKNVKVNLPVIWNSNSYYSQPTSKLLAGFIDVYLLDFKYGSNECAEKISDAPEYWQACTRNHLYAEKYGEPIIRVLVLPEHLECCTKPILSWISKKLGRETRVNLMFQYRSEWRAKEIPELRRRLTNKERDEAKNSAKKAGLTNFIT